MNPFRQAQARGRISRSLCGPLQAMSGSHAVSSPQTRRAVSTTSLSFCSWSAGVMAFPITELEKPHCGLTAKRSRGTKRLASTARAARPPPPPPPAPRKPAAALASPAQVNAECDARKFPDDGVVHLDAAFQIALRTPALGFVER